MTIKFKAITKAGCLVIGDEVLNGKILDTNSHRFARFCFNELSIPLKKTIVCSDDKEDIIESIRILEKQCDFIITSGGIGPTHDDVTYEALAEAFNLRCGLDREVVDRMNRLRGDYLKGLSKEQLESFYRMAEFPESRGMGDGSISVEKIFVDEELWVPIIGINEKIYILPGVPQLFEKLLDGLGKHVKSRIYRSELKRYYVKTGSKESELAPFLTDLQGRCDDEYGKGTVKLGSYPHFTWGINTISIIGNNKVTNEKLRVIVEEIVNNIGNDAAEITQDEEDNLTTQDPQSSSTY